MEYSDMQVRQHSRHFISVSMVVLLIVSLGTYGFSWMIGGDTQLDHMGGMAGLGLVIAALVVAIVAAIVTKPKE